MCAPATFHVTSAVVYVISRVFRLNFTSHCSTPHHIKRFHITHHSITSHQNSHITPPFTSHHSTPRHSTSHCHCTTFHITLFHTTCSTPHLAGILVMCHNTSHFGPPYSTSDVTLHRSLPPTTISHCHISKDNIFHVTQPVHISTIPTAHHTYIEHHSTFPHHTMSHIALHHHILILNHTTTS